MKKHRIVCLAAAGMLVLFSGIPAARWSDAAAETAGEVMTEPETEQPDGSADAGEQKQGESPAGTDAMALLVMLTEELSKKDPKELNEDVEMFREVYQSEDFQSLMLQQC